jgi:hypothetical protein
VRSDLRFRVLVKLLVTNYVCNVIEVESVCSHLEIPILVQNVLDLVSVRRATHMPNSDNYLKVCIL